MYVSCVCCLWCFARFCEFANWKIFLQHKNNFGKQKQNTEIKDISNSWFKILKTKPFSNNGTISKSVVNGITMVDGLTVTECWKKKYGSILNEFKERYQVKKSSLMSEFFSVLKNRKDGLEWRRKVFDYQYKFGLFCVFFMKYFDIWVCVLFTLCKPNSGLICGNNSN